MLEHTLFDYEVTKNEKDEVISEQNLVESFLSAKKIEKKLDSILLILSMVTLLEFFSA